MDGASPDAAAPRPTTPPVRKRRFRRLTIGLSLLAALLLCEVGARVITSGWSGADLGARLDRGPVIGGYTRHDELPYVLARKSGPSPDGRLDKEFRGVDDVPAKRPGVARVICVGASTTYGRYVEPSEAYPAVLERLLNDRGVACEVFNAGVPGWIAAEHVLNLRSRLLRLAPDLIVLHCGRNDVFPQFYNDFRTDGSHYRRPGFDFTQSGAVHKYVFRASHLAMVLCSWRGDRFGWNTTDAHPVYGCIDRSNRPSADDVARHLTVANREIPFILAVREVMSLCNDRDVKVVAAPMAVLPDRVATNNLDVGPWLAQPFGMRVQANNEILEEVAREYGAPFPATDALVDDPSLFHDDCHVNATGHARKAAILLGPVEAELRRR